MNKNKSEQGHNLFMNIQVFTLCSYSCHYSCSCSVLVLPRLFLRLTLYIIPKNKNLLFQYNKLALLINRNKDEIKEVLKYLCDIINNDYSRHYNYELSSINYTGSDDDVFYEFTLNIGDTILYTYYETSINSSYNFDINDIILPLVYLVKPMNLL